METPATPKIIAELKEVKKEQRRFLTNIARNQKSYEAFKELAVKILRELPLKTLKLALEIKNKNEEVVSKISFALGLDIPRDIKKEMKQLRASLEKTALMPDELDTLSKEELQDSIEELEAAELEGNLGEMSWQQALENMKLKTKLGKAEIKEAETLLKLFDYKLKAIDASSSDFLFLTDDELEELAEKGDFVRLHELSNLFLTKEEKEPAASLKRLKKQNKFLEKQWKRVKKDVEKLRKSDLGFMCDSYKACEKEGLDPYHDLLADPFEILDELDNLLYETDMGIKIAQNPEEAMGAMPPLSENGTILVHDPFGRQVEIPEEEFYIWQSLLGPKNEGLDLIP